MVTDAKLIVTTVCQFLCCASRYCTLVIALLSYGVTPAVSSCFLLYDSSVNVWGHNHQYSPVSKVLMLSQIESNFSSLIN